MKQSKTTIRDQECRHTRCFAGGEKDLGFYVQLDPMMTSSDLEKSDLGKKRFYTAVKMHYL